MHNLGKLNSSKESSFSGFLLNLVWEDKQDYADYKLGSLEDKSKDKMQQMEVLSVLDGLSFPMNEVGTYFFKDVIIKTIRYLDGTDDFGNSIDRTQLLDELRSPFSQFYFDIARNELDIGVKTFHSYIEHALESVQYENADAALLFEIYSNFSKETDYGEHALIIAEHIRNARRKTEGYQYTLISPVKVQVSI